MGAEEGDLLGAAAVQIGVALFESEDFLAEPEGVETQAV